MMPALLALFGAMSVFSVSAGLLRILAWQDRRYSAQLAAEYRAYVMVEEAKREVRRG